MKAWLESIVVSLQEDCAENPKKQLVSAVCIAYCFFHSITSVQPKIDKFVVPLLKMLCLKPDLTNQSCPSYVYLCEVLPDSNGLRYVCTASVFLVFMGMCCQFSWITSCLQSICCKCHCLAVRWSSFSQEV